MTNGYYMKRNIYDVTRTRDCAFQNIFIRTQNLKEITALAFIERHDMVSNEKNWWH